MSIATELLSLTTTGALTAYLVGTAAETYYFFTHGTHLTDFHSVFNLWAVPFVILAHRKAHKTYRHARKSRQLGCKPGKWLPQSDPILGIDFLKRMKAAVDSNSVPELWHSWYRQMGNTFATHLLGTTIMFTAEPENVKTVLATDFDSFPVAGPRLMATMMTVGRHSILSVNGKEWHNSRALIRPTFVRNQMTDMACMDRHLENFLSAIPRDGSTVEMQKLFHMLTMDTSTDFMFGQSTDTLTKPTKEAMEFSEAFDNAMEKAGTGSRIGKLSMLWPDRDFDRDVKYIRAFTEKFIDDALKSEKPRERGYVFLDELAKTGASPVEIRDQILGLILGGRDTTASALSALLWHLARRPDVVEKLREESASLHGEKPTWEELKNMKYLNMVLKEILRLHAPVFANSREAARDTSLPLGGGPDGRSPVFIPKGTVVRWSLFSLHRRKDIYGEDAEEFNPERWEKQRPSWEWVPFSGGPRICIGQQFALTQMMYTVTRMFQTFKAVEARDDKPLLTKVRITASLANGCKVALTPA